MAESYAERFPLLKLLGGRRATNVCTQEPGPTEPLTFSKYPMFVDEVYIHTHTMYIYIYRSHMFMYMHMSACLCMGPFRNTVGPSRASSPGAAVAVDVARRNLKPAVCVGHLVNPTAPSTVIVHTRRLLCSSFLVMTCFLIRDGNILPKQELHRSPQIVGAQSSGIVTAVRRWYVL